MDSRPIGIFDSGLGGLTAMSALEKLLPEEDLVYFGDTARVPYGTRSEETVVRFALQDAQFLLHHNVKLVVVACGTVSSIALEQLRRLSPVPVIGIVEPVVQAAVAATQSGHLAIWGTSATIRSQAIARRLQEIDKGLVVTSLACPLLVPMIENGYVLLHHPIVQATLLEYISQVIDNEIDTLILGCTHFPLVAEAIRQLAPWRLIDSGQEIARAAQRLVRENGLARNEPGRKGLRNYYVSDTVANFTRVAERFLGGPFQGEVHQVRLEELPRLI